MEAVEALFVCIFFTTLVKFNELCIPYYSGFLSERGERYKRMISVSIEMVRLCR